MDKKLIDELKAKSEELSDWLHKNFDPYTVVVITDTEVKIVRIDCATQFTRT